MKAAAYFQSGTTTNFPWRLSANKYECISIWVQENNTMCEWSSKRLLGDLTRCTKFAYNHYPSLNVNLTSLDPKLHSLKVNIHQIHHHCPIFKTLNTQGECRCWPPYQRNKCLRTKVRDIEMVTPISNSYAHAITSYTLHVMKNTSLHRTWGIAWYGRETAAASEKAVQ